MTEEEQEWYLEYVRNDEYFSRYYDEIIVLFVENQYGEWCSLYLHDG